MELPVPEEPPHRSATSCKNRVINTTDSDEGVNEKIQKILKLLTLRDQCALTQFWSPSSVGRYNLVKTVDQLFGLGIHNQGLCDYKCESERIEFLVDEECKEEDLIPIVRVFRQRLSEWTYDIKNYHSKKHPLKDYAIRWNLHGYLVLPVFDSITMVCVGVLEIITSSRYLDCAYEVKEVHRRLKEVSLTSPQAFDCLTSYVCYKNRQHELDEIFKVLKDVCRTHKLPLAQTWSVSSRGSFVAVERNIKETCSSFNATCIEKVCMSTNGLPFYVHDLRFWHFREACREHHLLKSKGVVGRALSYHGSCFCADVTKLGEEEYSLVHNARMNGLTSCFVVYFHSSEHDHDYLVEFFLPVEMKEYKDLQNLVQMIKMQCKFSSFEIGDLLSNTMIGMPMEASEMSLAMQLDTTQRSSSKEIMKLDYENPQVEESNVAIDCINAQDQCDLGQVSHNKWSIVVTNTKEVNVKEVITSKNIDVSIGGKECKSRGKPTSMKQSRKHRNDSLTSIGETSMSLGSLSREILQQDSRKTQTTHETIAQNQHAFSNDYPKKWSGAIMNTEGMSVDDSRSKKLNVVTREKRACVKKRRKRKMDSITQESIRQYFGTPIGEASKRLGVSRSTLKRVCRELNIASWPTPHRSKKCAHFGISVVVLLLIRVKRWICSSNRHGFSARWWICGKHNAFVRKSNPSANISPKDETICQPLYFSQLTKESNESKETTTIFSRSSKAHFSVHQASPKKNVVNVSDTRMVTVKATFKDDIIKFQFPFSSGLSELKDQVAKRIKLNSTRLRLKYRDEDDDLILISCDADVYNLMPFSASSVSKNTIKLIVQMADG